MHGIDSHLVHPLHIRHKREKDPHHNTTFYDPEIIWLHKYDDSMCMKKQTKIKGSMYVHIVQMHTVLYTVHT